MNVIDNLSSVNSTIIKRLNVKFLVVICWESIISLLISGISKIAIPT